MAGQNAPIPAYVSNGQPADPNRQASGPSYTYDNQYKNDQGYQNRTSYGGVVGGADQNVNRYRSLGEAAGGRAAYNANYGQFQYGQGQARDAMDLQRSAALGQQPSQAQLLGRNMIDQSLQAQMAGAASARGGPEAEMEAQRRAQMGAAGFQAQGMGQLAALSAQEMAQARGEYANTALGYGNQALGQTAQQIQNEQFQRGLNQQGQMGYEQLGFNVNQDQLQANLHANDSANQMGASNIQSGAHSSDFGFQKVAQVAGAAAGGAGTAAAALIPKAAHGGPIFAQRAGGGPVEAPVGLNGIPLTRDEMNLAEAAKIRSSFDNAGGEYDPTLGSMGDRAQAVYDKQHGGPGMGQVIGNSLGAMGARMPQASLTVAPIGGMYRAAGGPVAPHPYLVGENGPELVVPKNDGYVMTAQQTAALLGAPPTPQQEHYLASRGMAHQAARFLGGPIAAGSETNASQPGGTMRLGGSGMNVMGSLAATNAADTQYLHNPGFAREDGGPVASYDTRLSPDREMAFLAWKAQYAPHDSGADYDLRGAYAAGIRPDAQSGHWPDTYKKPNHETFSDESQYAAAAPFEAGHWNGEEHTPGLARQARAAREAMHSLRGILGRREEGGPVQADLARLLAARKAQNTAPKHMLVEQAPLSSEKKPGSNFIFPTRQERAMRTELSTRAAGGPMSAVACMKGGR